MGIKKNRKKRSRVNEKIKRLGKRLALGKIGYRQYNSQVDSLVSKSLQGE